MQNAVMNRPLLSAVAVLTAVCLGTLLAPSHSRSYLAAAAVNEACANDDSGLQLPAGFCATVFGDKLGHVRHLAEIGRAHV